MEIQRLKHRSWGNATCFYHDDDTNLDDMIVRIQVHTFDEAYEWCEQQLGPSGERWYAYSWAFFIRDDVDAVAFRLRWG